VWLQLRSTIDLQYRGANSGESTREAGENKVAEEEGGIFYLRFYIWDFDLGFRFGIFYLRFSILDFLFRLASYFPFSICHFSFVIFHCHLSFPKFLHLSLLHKPQITNHKPQSQIANHKSQIANHKSQIANHKSQIANRNHKSTDQWKMTNDK